MTFADFGLRAELLEAVQASGYTTPTPIQDQAIPAILNGDDLLAAAQTGTGKTAAFTLPLLHRLAASEPAGKRRPVRLLVIAPTRELAAQIHESVKSYGRSLPLRSGVIFGGVGMQPQIDRLRKGVDVLIATPGRLLDHLQRGNARLDGVETVVLDEADRMLDMGFIHDIRKILKMLPAKRQTLLFSATFSAEIRRLASGMLTQPTEIDVAPRNSAAETVAQRVYRLEKAEKRRVLSRLIRDGDWQQVLVFTRTKHGANNLSRQLDQDGLSAEAIHGNKSQAARTRALDGFKRGKVRVLVATDIAARGLDIDHLPHVVNYDLPHVAEDYVHRIGRTGRAGNAGEAISLVAPDEARLLKGIERLLKRPLERADANA
ncbi:MAG: DEAD/DEAH box helicase [Spiribacter salinus]|jgi:ATP-dependent RNA helicase RhlE|uniref:DEAD-box ATP-dependent RNA helicase RhpA n=1 Tax=Spiribacter salinus TaxID=1335746 RepID=A0A540VJI8_9GAMM|nr:DEAD/DEAH box helicase [Spiribacter sp.]MDR9454219.1 DEAD/DEAH box helicase [Spiribacter sp.]TQE96886.1 MAG: DEAD/DEAH box helicase [Spiribacter salinus]